jgi:uncharacterized protein (DUF433 family)
MNQRQIAAIVRMKKSGYRVVAIAKHYEISVEMVVAALVESKLVPKSQQNMRLKNVTNGVY